MITSKEFKRIKSSIPTRNWAKNQSSKVVLWATPIIKVTTWADITSILSALISTSIAATKIKIQSSIKVPKGIRNIPEIWVASIKNRLLDRYKRKPHQISIAAAKMTTLATVGMKALIFGSWPTWYQHLEESKSWTELKKVSCTSYFCLLKRIVMQWCALNVFNASPIKAALYINALITRSNQLMTQKY